MRRVKAAVHACYQRYRVPGLASVQVRIRRDGSVGRAELHGLFASTPTGACVEDALAAARFPSFSGAPITITYPYALR